MNKIFLKVLGLDEASLTINSSRSGWVAIITGILFFILAFSFFIGISFGVSKFENKSIQAQYQIYSDSKIPPNNPNILRMAHLLEVSIRYLKHISYILTGAFFFLGIIIITKGIMYLKINQLLKKSVTSNSCS